MLTLIVSLLLSPWLAAAQNPPTPATIAGRVMSDATAAPLSGAIVRSGAAATTTDSDGRFVLPLEARAAQPVRITITNPVSTVGAEYQVIDSPRQSNRFFRLQYP